jgi:aminopeptidase-like protein
MSVNAETKIPSIDRGAQLYALVEELYPICRSITGAGLRASLDIIERFIPLERTNVPTGKQVFDWEIPLEWNIRDAYIKNANGERIVDFQKSNLHVVNYSEPVPRQRLSLDQLRPHLHSLPEHPTWIPYRTSYYRKSWGFCLPHAQLEALTPAEYEVHIDSSLEPGALTLAECYLPGDSRDEVLIYTHVCHPSLCNDNLSAVAVAAFLAQSIAARPRALSYRIVFGPTTIGSIAWLSLNETRTKHVRHGLVLASLGDSGDLVYKRSRRGDTDTDRIAEYMMAHHDSGVCEDFSPYGYDERQFCSPGFNLAVGRLTRTPNGRYPQYHTSADNLDFISASALERSLEACERICLAFEENTKYLNLKPKCEPRLGPRGLFRSVISHGPNEFEHALLWILNQSDGSNDLLDIAKKSGLDFSLIVSAAKALADVSLIEPIGKAASEIR